ncbi:hypothetical protein ME9_01700, partial [Bartonella taylorii 8TBB]
AIPQNQRHNKKLVNELQTAVKFLQQRRMEEQNNAITQTKSKDVMKSRKKT